jgi:hypothetical protein
MKKILLSLISVLAGTGLQAQLTQANHAPANGDSYQMYQVDSTGINAGASGAGVTWAFTVATRTNVLLNFAVATNTSSSFPSASVAVSNGSNTSYFTSTASDLLYYGGNFSTSSGGITVKATLNYTTPAIAASYPMSLNTTSSMATAGSINVTAPLVTNGTFNGNSTVILDGTGTLTMPGSGTFTNVSRVVSTQTINFTTPIASGTLTQKVYDYYSAGTKEPILSILNATANVPNFGSPSQVLVYKNKNAQGTTSGTTTVGMTQLENIFTSVYPNPSSTIVTVESELSGPVAIYDVTGKQVAVKEMSDGKATVNVSQLNAGLYIYKINDNTGKNAKTGKITVSH